MTLSESRELFELHAEFCQAIAHPARLMIITLLGVDELTVGQMVEAIGISIANTSQHLRAMRDRNIVLTRRDGRNIYYRLRDPRLGEACRMIRGILLRGLDERGRLARQAGASKPPSKTPSRRQKGPRPKAAPRNKTRNKRGDEA